METPEKTITKLRAFVKGGGVTTVLYRFEAQNILRCVAVPTEEVERLRAKAQLADEMAAKIDAVENTPSRSWACDWLTRYTRIENQEAGDAE